MTTAIHKVMLYAHTYTCSEALCSMEYNSKRLCALIHGVKLYALSYTWSEPLCSLL